MFSCPRTAKNNLEMCFSLPLHSQLPPLLPLLSLPIPSPSPPGPSYLPFNPTLPTLPLPPLCVSVCRPLREWLTAPRNTLGSRARETEMRAAIWGMTLTTERNSYRRRDAERFLFYYIINAIIVIIV